MRTDLQSERYALLVRQLGERRQLRRGWQSAVAEELGVDRSFVSRVLSGARKQISDETIETACKKLRLRRDFFTIVQQDGTEPVFFDFLSSAPDERGGSSVVGREIDSMLLSRLEEHSWRDLTNDVARMWRDPGSFDKLVVPPEDVDRLAQRVLNHRLFQHAQRVLRMPRATTRQKWEFEAAAAVLSSMIMTEVDHERAYWGEPTSDEEAE